MLVLSFHAPCELLLGPARAFSIESAFIRQHPHDEIVSRYRDGAWHLVDEFGVEVAARGFECRNGVRLQFEDAQGRVSPRYGRFGQLQYRDESIFADDQLFAVRLPTQQWQHRESGVRWRVLNLLAAWE